MAPKRGDEVAAPVQGAEWHLQFGTSDAARDWPGLTASFAGPCRAAWERMRHHPLERSAGQKPLAGALAERTVGGRDLPQWQIDISAGGRARFCVDEQAHRVWLVQASAGHPGATLAKGKRSSTNR